jgi:hypothetical protein
MVTSPKRSALGKDIVGEGEWELHRTVGIGIRTLSLVLVRRRKTLRVQLRKRESALFGLAFNLFDLPGASLSRLRDATSEACRLIDSGPLS